MAVEKMKSKYSHLNVQYQIIKKEEVIKLFLNICVIVLFCCSPRSFRRFNGNLFSWLPAVWLPPRAFKPDKCMLYALGSG